jgi:hypothetical protein
MLIQVIDRCEDREKRKILISYLSKSDRLLNCVKKSYNLAIHLYSRFFYKKLYTLHQGTEGVIGKRIMVIWLEYSVGNDAAFCFYFFLFKQPKAHNYGID